MQKTNKKQARVVLVTGATSGIGRAITQLLVTRGCRVYGTGRGVEFSAARANAPGWVPLDVTRVETVEKAVADVIATEGRLDAVVNNAGIGMMGALGDTTEDELMRVFQTNVVGLHTVSRVAAPHLIASRGHLIQIGSVAGVVTLPFRGVYCASKAAVEKMGEAWSMELARHGVRVTVLRLGDFKTAINKNRLAVASPNLELYPGFEKVCQSVHTEVARAWDPAAMGDAVWKILNSKRPPLLCAVAPLMQRFSIVLKHTLPARLFERLIARRYHL